MATSSSSAPEEARPPEANRKSAQYWRSVDNDTCQNDTSSDIGSTNHCQSMVPTPVRSRLRNVLFPKRRISCITSTDSERNINDCAKVSVIEVPKAVVAVPPAESRPKTRHSVHLDVDEALSSLLWQPYEYQNANNNNNNDRYSLSSYDDSCSCSDSSGGSSSRSDLVSTVDNKTFQCNNGNMAAVQHRRSKDYCLMLHQQDVNNRAALLKSRARRRPTTAATRAEVEGGASSHDGLTLSVAYLADSSLIPCSSAFGPYYQCLHGDGSSMRADLPPSQLQQQVVPPPPLPTLPPRPLTTTNVSVNGGTTTLSTTASLHSANVVGLPQHGRQSSIPGGSTTIYPNHPRTASEPSRNVLLHPNQRQHVDLLQQRVAAAKLRTANSSTLLNVISPPVSKPLVDLLVKNDFNTPQQRAPLDLSGHGGGTASVDHLNKMLEQKPQLSITHQRIPSDCNRTGSTAPSELHITHQRTVSDIAQSSTVRNDPINKVRSSDVMAGMVMQPSQVQRVLADVNNGNNLPNVVHQRSNSNPNNRAGGSTNGLLNVSNVNVNYYRAVPVNVVSSVPTIHCVNTTNESAGTTTNVSNVNIVQAMSSNNNNIAGASHHSVSTTTLNNDNNNTSANTTCTEVIVHSTQEPQHQNQPPVAPPRLLPPTSSTNTRTFTSTEAQTDEILSAVDANQPNTSATVLPDPGKEQRRRERRERKHQRRMNNVNHRHNNTATTANNNNSASTPSSVEQWSGTTNTALPDILNSHLPPPYTSGTTLVSGSPPVLPPPPPPPPAAVMVPAGYHHHHHHHGLVPTHHHHGLVTASGAVITQGPMGAYHGPQVVSQLVGVPTAAGGATAVPPGVAVPVVPPPHSGFRFPFPTTGFRRSRYSDDHPPKGCCGILSWKPGSLRWFIALIALVAVCCVLVGTALGAMRPAGRDHLTVSLLMIGVGIVLVTVSAVAWRLTSHSPTSCRTILGLGPATSTESIDICGGGGGGSNSRRFVPRLPPAYGRPHHPYAAMLYPEFQYRAPPPTYQASMQEYRLRLLLLDRGGGGVVGGGGGGGGVVSPPPTYRSHAGSLLRSTLSHRRNHPNTPSLHPYGHHHHLQHPTLAHSDYSVGSCPPSYRSQSSLARSGPVIVHAGPGGPATAILHHSRDHSLTLSEPGSGVGGGVGGGVGEMVNVVSILNGGSDVDSVRLVEGGYGGLVGGGMDAIKLDGVLDSPDSDTLHINTSSKTEDLDTPNHLKDGNLVTIVQTGDDHSPVIVTVSGGGHRRDLGANVQITEIAGSEMEILAHL